MSNQTPLIECEACQDVEDSECQKCCEHSDVDYPCCLICGKDMTEDFACAAEAAYDSEMDR